MLNKIFLGLFAAAAVTMSIFVFFAHRQLQSIGFKPEIIAQSFTNSDAVSWKFLWFSAIALLVLANVVLWTTRRSWALWLTLAYFAAFVLVESWWLGGLFSEYARQNNLAAANSFFDYLSGNYIFGAILCITAAAAVFFNQFLVLRLRERLHPLPAADVPAAAADLPPVHKEDI